MYFYFYSCHVNRKRYNVYIKNVGRYIMSEHKSKKIGVLMGGLSPERDISIKSGTAVLDVLLERGWNAVAIDVQEDVAQKLLENNIDIAYNALHGVYGEDGCIQGLLEILKIPYTGSGVRSSAISMDKIATKRALQHLDQRELV